MPAASPAAIVASTLILTINGQSFEATTADTPAARELAARAPFELNMQELNGNEKYASLDRALPAAAQSVGRIEAGDVMLWGRDCLVLFYASFNTPYRYTRIAKITDPRGLARAAGSGSVTVRFSLNTKN